MSELPEGWSSATLGNLADYLNGAAFKPEDWGETGLPIIRIQNLTDPSKPFNRTHRVPHDKYIVREGDILVSWSATLDSFIWRGEDSLLNQHIFKVTPYEGIDCDYLFYLLRGEIVALIESEHLHGSTMKHINRGPFLAHEVGLPPREEQRRIAAKLDSLFARSKSARCELDQIPLLIEHYKQAILEKAFSGELTADWRRTRKLAAPKNVDLGSVAVDFKYGTSAKSGPTGKMPVLRMGNIQSMVLDWSDLVYTSDGDEIRKYELKTGDVLFNRTNSPELVGKTAIYRGEQPAIYAGYLIRIKCGDDLLPDYLNYCLNSPMGRDYCWQVKTDGVSQSNINAKKLAAFEIPLPAIEEQWEIIRRIAAALEWVNTVASEEGQALRLLDHLDQALLGKAFRGELVPQDPNDEPAEKLLERIRSVRATKPKAKRERGRTGRDGVEDS